MVTLYFFTQIKGFFSSAFSFILFFVFYLSPLSAENLSSEIAPSVSQKNNQKIKQVAKQQALTFDVWEYRVAGNSLIERKLLERALNPYLGPNKSSKVINDAADALERLYKNNGYPTVFVDIPEQNVIAGRVRLQVNQGIVSRLRITGSDYFTLSGLKERVPSLQTGQTLHMPTVQNEIKKLHSYSPDMQAIPILKAGRDPGSVEIELRVKDKRPLHGSLELNNHYSANTSKSRLEGSVSYDNLWQKFHSIKIQTQLSPEKTNEVKALVANYMMPVNEGNNRLAFYAVRSDSDISAVGGLAVIGKGNILGTRYVIPLKNNSTLNHSITLGFDYKDVEDLVSLQSGASIKTPIKYAVASASYAATQVAENTSTRYIAGFKFGLRGVNSRGEFEDKRFKAAPDFFYFQGEVDRTDHLPSALDLKSHIKLQLADSPLISNEQFTAGGFSSVRGYFESQVLGDIGMGVGLELFLSKLFEKNKNNLKINFLTFVEGAVVETLEPLPGQQKRQELLSAGVGLRVTKSKQLMGKIDWAYPLRDAGDVGSGTLVSKGDSRLIFSFVYSF